MAAAANGNRQAFPRARSNRELPLLESTVTHSKQTTAPPSNRELWGTSPRHSANFRFPARRARISGTGGSECGHDSVKVTRARRVLASAGAGLQGYGCHERHARRQFQLYIGASRDGRPPDSRSGNRVASPARRDVLRPPAPLRSARACLSRLRRRASADRRESNHLLSPSWSPR